MNTPVVKMFCHDAPVQALTVDREGRCVQDRRFLNIPFGF